MLFALTACAALFSSAGVTTDAWIHKADYRPATGFALECQRPGTAGRDNSEFTVLIY
jgi:hypothetical protein